MDAAANNTEPAIFFMWKGNLRAAMSLLAASLLAAQIWYIVPLIVSVSLVYGATRHELPRPILYHAWHTAVWMAVFMGGIFVVLWLVSMWL